MSWVHRILNCRGTRIMPWRAHPDVGTVGGVAARVSESWYFRGIRFHACRRGLPRGGHRPARVWPLEIPGAKPTASRNWLATSVGVLGSYGANPSFRGGPDRVRRSPGCSPQARDLRRRGESTFRLRGTGVVACRRPVRDAVPATTTWGWPGPEGSGIRTISPCRTASPRSSLRG